jgi:hypothetical protein
MSTDTPREQAGDKDCPPPREPDPGCDPTLIDDVACRASGVAAQAAYDATYQADLDQAKTHYDKARKDYRAARHDAALQVQDLRHQIKHILERIRCLIEQKRVWRCLDDAFCEIVDELRCCEGKDGCCIDECEFEVDDATTLKYRKLLKRIARYQADVDEAKECFSRLVGEPAALTARVAEAKAAIDALNTALSADPAVTDLKVVYAQGLVANRAIERIWGGFDQAQDYVDCLCRALTCWTKGCAAVSVLTGAKAVAECKRAAREARCEHLRTNTVDEILAMYDKLCPERECPDEPPKDDGDESCPVCGERHHHHHRRHDDDEHHHEDEHTTS